MIRKALVEMTGGLCGAHTMPVMAIAGALEKWQSVSVVSVCHQVSALPVLQEDPGPS